MFPASGVVVARNAAMPVCIQRLKTDAVHIWPCPLEPRWLLLILFRSQLKTICLHLVFCPLQVGLAVVERAVAGHARSLLLNGKWQDISARGAGGRAQQPSLAARIWFPPSPRHCHRPCLGACRCRCWCPRRSRRTVLFSRRTRGSPAFHAGSGNRAGRATPNPCRCTGGGRGAWCAGARAKVSGLVTVEGGGS